MARLVFDLDGTLIDSAPDVRGIANGILAALEARPLSLPETRRFMGEGVPTFVDRMIASRELDPCLKPRMLTEFMKHYDTAVELTRVYPGVPEILASLSTEGHRLGLCTNKPERPARAVLRHLDLDGAFDAIVGGDTLNRRKPDPAPLHSTFDRLGDVGAQIYIGDSETDAETALRADVPFLLYTNGYRKGGGGLTCRAAFSDFAELPALVARLS
ncbi:Phosphoglycolate phosphatase, plasmid [Pseudooceanicola marinus]|uniref:phosphoglycolate phosphatase n=1 Tax=Pseudooceanicola marinus TaxID=396013 RepID=A0A1X7A685_9RHOB|nr:HAD-IA family hydrolase [Pseudooceanicola marinus]PJE27234.1 phosphoglycolate phosphatase [Pseudooceanicola marinus]SLN71164.1 Phosphoglycolate phosphatase, plasmid [Pseudooceanicola marinus]